MAGQQRKQGQGTGQGGQGQAGQGGKQGDGKVDDDGLDELLKDDDTDDGEQDDGDDDGGEGDGDVAAQLKAMEKRLSDGFTSEMDRRINQVVNRGRRRQTDDDGDEDQGRGRPKGKTKTGEDTDRQQQESAAAERRLDLREARMAMTDAFSGKTTGWTTEEVDAAKAMARGQLGALLEKHDPDEAGEKAARAAIESVSGLRASIEKQVIGKLRKRGVLVEKKDGEGGTGEGQGAPSGQGSPTGRQPISPANVTDKTKAARERAAAMNQRAGHKVEQQAS